MKSFKGRRAGVALIASVIGLGAVGAGPASAQTGPVTRTFSFIGSAGQPNVGKVILNIDGLVINARCSASGEPIIYAFTNSTGADLFGRVFDGFGRLSSIKNSAFVKGHSVRLSVTNGDFDASGNVLYETISSKVVTVNYAFDNSTTLGKRNVCTVYGSAVAS